jgi:hypothetical protein
MAIRVIMELMDVRLSPRNALFWLLLGLIFVSLGAKYDVKDLQIGPAHEYTAHLDFQNVVIGAYPCTTEAKTLELFDTEKLHEKGILPVLLVIDNNNVFPIQVSEADIYLVDKTGQQERPIPFMDVLLEVSLKKPITESLDKKQLDKIVKKEMRLDFEHKSFGEKLIGPNSSDYGVVFFRLPQDGDLEGYRLYFPEVMNFSEREALVFFEFDLVKTP